MTAKEALSEVARRRSARMRPSRRVGLFALACWALAYVYGQRIDEWDLVPAFLVVLGLAAGFYSAVLKNARAAMNNSLLAIPRVERQVLNQR